MNFARTSYGIGQPVTRKEDARFLVGRGRYVDDLQLENQCHLHIVYSDRAHAVLRRVDTLAARKAPGVIAILTGEDCAADGLGGIEPRFLPQDFPFGWPAAFRTCRPILVRDKVRHVGERIAAIVAQTPDQARDAAELIEIEYEDLSPVMEVEAALADGAPLVHDEAGSNRVWTLRLGDPRTAEKAFERAAHRVEVDVRHPRIAPSPMEPRAAVGVYAPEEELFTLYTATQAPHILRNELACFVLHVPESSVRVISNDVGGAFGLKTTPFAEDAVVLWAAKRVGRPVKWRGSRLDCMMSDDQGRGQIGRAEAAFDSEGRFLAVRCRFLHDVGAYIVGAGTMPMVHSAKLVESIYRVPELDVESSLVFTNAPPTTPYRGAGRPEAIFAVERCLDEAAEILGIDRLEIRRRNMLRPEELPYQNHTGFVFDTGEFVEILDRCAEEADWTGFAQRQQSRFRASHQSAARRRPGAWGDCTGDRRRAPGGNVL
jgi:aerobic carbon-monoxide dehydrogenase large subunit